MLFNLLFADIDPGGVVPWVSIAREIGVLAALTGFFTWQSWRREERLVERVTNLETFINERLIEVIRTSMGHIADNTDTMKHCSENMQTFIQKLGTRPCLYEDMIKTLSEQGYEIKKKEGL